MATIRVSAETRARIQELAEGRQQSMSDLVAIAVDRLWRIQLLGDLNEYYADLRGDPESWQRELDERAAWAAIEHWDDE